jgi:hypothetical protein
MTGGVLKTKPDEDKEEGFDEKTVEKQVMRGNKDTEEESEKRDVMGNCKTAKLN